MKPIDKNNILNDDLLVDFLDDKEVLLTFDCDDTMYMEQGIKIQGITPIIREQLALESHIFSPEWNDLVILFDDDES